MIFIVSIIIWVLDYLHFHAIQIIYGIHFKFKFYMVIDTKY